MTLDNLSLRLQEMVPHFSEQGYAVVPVPENLYSTLLEIFIEGRYMFDAFLPEKPHGIVESADRAPTLVLGGTGFGDNRPSLIHESSQLRQILEDFCGCSLKPTYWYGPRLYQRGAILHEHIDRPLSHIISASIHVDSDLDEPWNISVESGGVRKEVNIEKGHMLLYEGVRLNHFRKAPLNGRWYAGTFMHYTVSDSSILPTDYLELAQQAQPCFRF